jgi:hypothetical protein
MCNIAFGIPFGVVMPIFLEDHSHMVEGISQGSMMWSRKLPLMHSHGKTSNGFDLVGPGYVFGEKVVSESDVRQYSDAQVLLSSVFPPTAF